MKTYLETAEIARAMNITERRVHQIADEQLWGIRFFQGRGRGGQVKKYIFNTLPEAVQQSVLAVRQEKTVPAVREESKRLEEYPQWQQQIAQDRLYLIKKLEEFTLEMKILRKDVTKQRAAKAFCDEYHAGRVDVKVLDRVNNISPRTLFRWERIMRNDGITGLIPEYGKRKGVTSIPPADQKMIRELYLNQQRPAARTVYQNMVTIKARQIQQDAGHSIPAEEAYEKAYRTVYSYDTVRRYIDRISETEKIARRQGYRAFVLQCLPYIERDPFSIDPNGIWVADGHTINVMVRHPYVNNKNFRPTIVAFMDVRTRLITGFDIGLTENTDVVVRALANGIKRFGIPKAVYLDNGRAFKNKQTMGVSRNILASNRNRINVADMTDESRMIGTYSRFGIEVIKFATPYNSRAKSVEPFWGGFNNYAARLFDTYTGRDINEKPEQLPAVLKEGEKIPTMEEFCAVIIARMEDYNNRQHSGKGMGNRSPFTVWKADIQALGGPVMQDEEYLDLLRLHRVRRKVVKGGGMAVKLNSMRYHSPVLADYIGAWVEIGIDVEDLNKVQLFDTDGKHLGHAERVPDASYNLAESADTMREFRQLKRMEKEAKLYIKKGQRLQDELNAGARARLVKASQVEEEEHEESKALPHLDSLPY